MIKLSDRSRKNLEGVHPDLVRVVEAAHALARMEFIVTEGLRTRARQEALVKAGASSTMNSRHLTGHAVDLAAVVDGEVRWDWPLYERLAAIVKTSAMAERVPIEWGGDWAIRDGPHFQLPWKDYPAQGGG